MNSFPYDKRKIYPMSLTLTGIIIRTTTLVMKKVLMFTTMTLTTKATTTTTMTMTTMMPNYLTMDAMIEFQIGQKEEQLELLD